MRPPIRTIANALHMFLPDGAQDQLWRLRNRRPWIDRSWSRSNGITRRTWPAHGPRFLTDRLWYRLTAGIPDLLRYEDRNGMASSVEGRVPFLTTDLVQFALSLPAHHLVDDGGETKNILRVALGDLLPRDVLTRTEKIGFAVPHASWPTLIPGFGSVLKDLTRIPAVAHEVPVATAARVASGRGVSQTDLFALWRLVGLGAWSRVFAPEYPPT